MPLVRGNVGWLATAVVAGACVLTNIWFTGRYGDVVSRLDGGAVVLLVARNALLVARAAILVAAVWRFQERQIGVSVTGVNANRALTG